MSRRKDRMTFETGGRVYPMRPPFEGADHAVVEGWTCPTCGGNKVAGAGRTIEGPHPSDTYRADGGCASCRKVVGVLRVKVAGTLFGLEEDERVASMGVRIY